jgi:hypothetical protein
MISEHSLLANTNNVVVEYSPNDFFYAVASKEKIMPSKETCNLLDINAEHWDVTCNADNFPDNYNDCINKELCKNQNNVEKINRVENNSNGADEKYENTSMEYGGIIMNTINLAIGILFLGGVIMKLRQT